MKRAIALFSLIIAFGFTSKPAAAQNGKVNLCDSYDDYGNPTGIHTSWTISPEGGYIYILYSQDYSINKELTLYVDKKNSSGNYVAFDTRYFAYDPQKDVKKFVVYDYNFKEDGDYKISVMGNGTTALAVSYCNIAFKKADLSDANSANKKKVYGVEDVDTYYFEDSKIIFGESIDDKAVVSGESTYFYLSNNKKDVMVKLQQDKPLKVTSVIVDVFGGDGYKEKISSQTYTIPDLTWDWIKVPVTFTKRGKYVVDIYNEDDVFINSGYVEIR